MRESKMGRDSKLTYIFCVCKTALVDVKPVVERFFQVVLCRADIANTYSFGDCATNFYGEVFDTCFWQEKS